MYTLLDRESTNDVELRVSRPPFTWKSVKTLFLLKTNKVKMRALSCYNVYTLYCDRLIKPISSIFPILQNQRKSAPLITCTFTWTRMKDQRSPATRYQQHSQNLTKQLNNIINQQFYKFLTPFSYIYLNHCLYFY